MSEATDDLRKIAQKRLKKKQDFKSYLFIWFVVSLIVSGIWFLATLGSISGRSGPLAAWESRSVHSVGRLWTVLEHQRICYRCRNQEDGHKD